jgi:hypothetical protein
VPSLFGYMAVSKLPGGFAGEHPGACQSTYAPPPKMTVPMGAECSGRVLGAAGSGFENTESQNSKIVDIDGFLCRCQVDEYE